MGISLCKRAMGYARAMVVHSESHYHHFFLFFFFFWVNDAHVTQPVRFHNLVFINSSALGDQDSVKCDPSKHEQTVSKYGETSDFKWVIDEKINFNIGMNGRI